MAQARWHGAIIAEDPDTVMVEGNHYFSPESIRDGVLQPSEHTSYCGWKGTARYFHVVVEGQRLENAAWVYPEPLEKAAHIKDRLAFWKGVEVTG
ncbi:MAG: DUF427 domain-containing protein [Bradymonadia bacterium]